MDVISFHYRQNIYCIKVTDIHEVIFSVKAVALPRIPNPFEGVFQHRGIVFSLLNFDRCMAQFNGVVVGENGDSQIIIFAEPYHQLAIRVPGAIETVRIEREEISFVGPEWFSSAILDGIVNRDEERYHLISATKLFLHAGKLIADAEISRRLNKE